MICPNDCNGNNIFLDRIFLYIIFCLVKERACGHIIEIKYEPFNIVGLIKKVQHILIFNSIQKNIEVKYTTKKIKEWIIGDSKNIQHVIMNLLSNAIKFSLPNSIIHLELECINIVNQQQHILITINTCYRTSPCMHTYICARRFTFVASIS